MMESRTIKAQRDQIFFLSAFILQRREQKPRERPGYSDTGWGQTQTRTLVQR